MLDGLKKFFFLPLMSGFDLKSWVTVLARYRFNIGVSAIPLACAVTLASLVISLLKMIEWLAFGARIRAARVHQAPLFILGHWRSGTTMLHELLSLDNRYGFPSSYSCFFPHTFLLTEHLVSSVLHRLRPPGRRLQDNMAAGPGSPQEDEFALSIMGAVSPVTSHIISKHPCRHAGLYELENISPEGRREWERTFLHFLRKLAARDSRPLILKSPAHTFRVPTLLRLFPDARFVLLVRNPGDVIPSLVHTWTVFARFACLNVPERQELEQYVLEVFNRMHLKFESDRHLIPPGRLHCMRYEDLTANPEAELEKLYAGLGLDGFEQVRPAVRGYTKKNSSYKRNRFRLSPGQHESIRRRCAGFIARHGYGDTAWPETAEPARHGRVS